MPEFRAGDKVILINANGMLLADIGSEAVVTRGNYLILTTEFVDVEWTKIIYKKDVVGRTKPDEKGYFPLRFKIKEESRVAVEKESKEIKC
jgi:hypothetical protein